MRFKFIIHILIIFVGFFLISLAYIFLYLRPNLVVMANNKREMSYLSEMNSQLVSIRLSIMEINNLNVTDHLYFDSFDENLRRVKENIETLSSVSERGVGKGYIEDSASYEETQEKISLMVLGLEEHILVTKNVLQFDPLKDFYKPLENRNYEAILTRVGDAETGLRLFDEVTNGEFTITAVFKALEEVREASLLEDSEGVEYALVDIVDQYSQFKKEVFEYTILPIKTSDSVDALVLISDLILQNQVRMDLLSIEIEKEGELIGRVGGFLNIF